MSDDAAADQVIAQINALPTEITLDNKAAVEAARAAYGDLTDAQKALVPADTLKKLTDANRYTYRNLRKNPLRNSPSSM